MHAWGGVLAVESLNEESVLKVGVISKASASFDLNSLKITSLAKEFNIALHRFTAGY